MAIVPSRTPTGVPLRSPTGVRWLHAPSSRMYLFYNNVNVGYRTTLLCLNSKTGQVLKRTMLEDIFAPTTSTHFRPCAITSKHLYLSNTTILKKLDAMTYQVLWEAPIDFYSAAVNLGDGTLYCGGKRINIETGSALNSIAAFGFPDADQFGNLYSAGGGYVRCHHKNGTMLWQKSMTYGRDTYNLYARRNGGCMVLTGHPPESAGVIYSYKFAHVYDLAGNLQDRVDINSLFGLGMASNINPMNINRIFGLETLYMTGVYSGGTYRFRKIIINDRAESIAGLLEGIWSPAGIPYWMGWYDANANLYQIGGEYEYFMGGGVFGDGPVKIRKFTPSGSKVWEIAMGENVYQRSTLMLSPMGTSSSGHYKRYPFFKSDEVNPSWKV